MPPHIVLIVTDDQRADSMLAMPKTRALLGAEGAGTTFANAIATLPWCSPSRVTMLTGQYAHGHGVTGNALPTGGFLGFQDDDLAFPVSLQAAGYRTALVGKYLNAYDGSRIPPGWDAWHALVDPIWYYGFTATDGGLGLFVGDEWLYQTTWVGDRATEIIAAHPPTTPLFLMVAPGAPHWGGLAPHVRGLRAELDDQRYVIRDPAYVGAYQGATCLPAASPSFNEADVSDKPGFLQLPLLDATAVYRIKEQWEAYLEALLSADDLVERIVGALAAAGMLDDTLLIFTSDNGLFLGEHRRASGKTIPYEAALRVPLLIRGGGFPTGHTAGQLVGNVDLAPTILGPAGLATLGGTLDGRDLRPLALDPARGLARRLAIEYGDPILTPGSWGRGFRTATTKYLRHASGEEEFYRLADDPDELQNLAADPAHAGTLEILREIADEQTVCSGETCSRGTP